MVLIGYSGHALVAAGILKLMGKEATAYCDRIEKHSNPLNLQYLGNEENNMEKIESENFFIAIGDNHLRKKITDTFREKGKYPLTIIHPSAIIDATAITGKYGVMISSNVCVNPLARIGEGVILNTASVIEHECVIGNFAHIGPGAVLCGDVQIGESAFIGAGSVIKQNVAVGRNCVVGAGSVVIRDVPANTIVAGNPAKQIQKKNQS